MSLRVENSAQWNIAFSEQVVREKDVLDTRATDLIIKSGQKDTEANWIKNWYCQYVHSLGNLSFNFSRDSLKAS